MIIEGMHFGVSKHLFDKHFTILWANDYAYGLTGYTKDEFYYCPALLLLYLHLYR